MTNNSIINEAKIDIKKAREWKDIAVKLTNLTIKYQSIDDANDYQRYILEDLELDIRERYPNMPIPTMRVLLNLVQKYLDGTCTPIFRQRNLQISNFQTVICLTLILRVWKQSILTLMRMKKFLTLIKL